MGYVKTRLSAMMFLHYVVWGLWLPILARYLQAPIAEGGLGFEPWQVNFIVAFGASSGAIVGPFIAGQIADRYFSAERFLAVLLIIGGVLEWIVAYQTSFTAWLILSILYSITYQPTIALTNSLAFSHLEDPNNEFPRVRIWGTIGWIVAAWMFPMIWLLSNISFQWLPPFYTGEEVPNVTARLVDALKWSGTISILYAFYALFLPHTPPKRDAVESLAFVKAFQLLKKPSFAVLFAAALPISIVHTAYFVQTSPYLSDAVGLRDSYIAPAMSIGQFAEILVMAVLGLFLTKLGFRWTIFIGAFAYFLRYAIFGTVDLPPGVIVASQALHGVCFACFFAAAFIYVDRIADRDARHSAQTFFAVVVLGIGPIIAAPVLSALTERFATDAGLNYAGLWYSLAAISIVTALAFLAFFRDETTEPIEGVEYTEEEILPQG